MIFVSHLKKPTNCVFFTNSLSQLIRIWWHANQLKTPANVSWAFKMVSQFGSLGYTIMGKTADLTVVQKTIIDTLHKEEKTQTFITKERLAVHRVLYPSMFTESWVEEKDAQPTERPQPYEDCQGNSIQEFGWTSQGMDWGWGQASRAPHTDVSRNLATVVVRDVLPGLREELDCCPVVQSPLFRWEQGFVFHLETKVWRKSGEAQSPSCLKSSVKFTQSVMIRGAMSSAGVGPLCFFENQRHCTRLPRHFGALHASFCWPAF